MPLHYKRKSGARSFQSTSHMHGSGIQYGGYIVPFKGSSYQYGGYINPFFGSPYQYGTGVGFYRRQSGAGFLDVVKGIFRFLMPIVAPAALQAGTTFMGNLSKGVEEGKSFKDSAKEALRPTLEAAIEKGKERFIAGQNKEGGGRKRRGEPVYKGQKKRRMSSPSSNVGRSTKRHKAKKRRNRRAKSKAKRGLKNYLKVIKRKQKGGKESDVHFGNRLDNF